MSSKPLSDDRVSRPNRACALACALLLALLAGPDGVRSAEVEQLKLPELGEGGSSLFSREFEHQLGRTWLTIFRSQVRTVRSPRWTLTLNRCRPPRSRR